MQVKIPPGAATPKQRFRHVVRVGEKLRRRRNSQKQALSPVDYAAWENDHYYPRARAARRQERVLRATLVGPAKQEAREDVLLADIDLENAFED